MERFQATVLAVLIAALVLFGLGYIVDDGQRLTLRRGGGVSEEKRIAFCNGAGCDRETIRGVPPPPGEGPRGAKRRRLAAGGESSGDDGSERRMRGGFLVDGTVGADGETGRGISPDLVAARTGMLPAGPTSGRERDGGQPPPSAPDQPPQQDPDEDPDLLLSVPLDGGLGGEDGETATEAEGVLLNGNSVEFTDAARVVFPAEGNVDAAQGTISFEVTPRWDGDSATSNSFVQISEPDAINSSLQLVKNFDNLRFILTDFRGNETDISVPITDWRASQPHRIDATWNGSEMALYIDRNRVGAAPLDSRLRFTPTTPIQIGSVGANYLGAGGQIRNLQIRGNALSGAEIAGSNRIVLRGEIVAVN